MNKKKFAIFITSYNYAKYISQAIESVINQSDPDWHLYIIDDNSNDNTYEVVKKYLEKDRRISWKKHHKNIGSVPTIIEGFRQIDADYISTLCSDDWLEPNFVADAKAAFEKYPEIPFCALGWSSWETFDNKQIITQLAKNPLSNNFNGKVFLSPYLVFFNFINLDFLVFKKSKLMPFLHELEKFKIRQYIETFLIKRLEQNFGACAFNAQSHGFWRRHSKQLTKEHTQNYQVYIEQQTETLFFCANENNLTLANLANKFITIAGFIERSKVPFNKSCEWLLSDLGTPFAENFANLDMKFIKDNQLEKSLLCLAACVWSSLIFNCNFGGWLTDAESAKKYLSQWIVELQNKYQLKNINQMFAEANKLYDGLFMPLIK